MAVIQQQPDDQWVRLHWPDSTAIDARRSVICYDHDSDTLFVHFHGRGRPAVSLLVGDYELVSKPLGGALGGIAATNGWPVQAPIFASRHPPPERRGRVLKRPLRNRDRSYRPRYRRQSPLFP